MPPCFYCVGDDGVVLSDMSDETYIPAPWENATVWNGWIEEIDGDIIYLTLEAEGFDQPTHTMEVPRESFIKWFSPPWDFEAHGDFPRGLLFHLEADIPNDTMTLSTEKFKDRPGTMSKEEAIAGLKALFCPEVQEILAEDKGSE